MNLSKFITVEPKLFVEIVAPTKEQIDAYHKKTGELPSTGEQAPRIFKKATILSTYNEETIPVGSEWIIGTTEGIKVNYFGNKITVIQASDLYSRISKES